MGTGSMRGEVKTVRRLRRLSMVVTAAWCLLFLPCPRQAAAEDVAVQDGILGIRAAPGEDNAILIQPDALGAYQVFDDGATLVPGPGCNSLSPTGVQCTGMILGIDVDSADGDDVIGAWAVDVPVAANAGPGDDLIDSGSAADKLKGEDGLDTVLAASGDDDVSGGDGGDLLEGGDGADNLRADAGDDIARAGDGSGDVVSGGPGRDLLDGGAGNDTVSGGAGDDAVTGGTGSDTVSTGTGKDAVYLARSNDTISCQKGDSVHAPRSDVPEGCTALAPEAQLPTSWPPAQRNAPPARAAIIGGPQHVHVTVLRKGHVQRVVVRIPGVINRLAHVRITAFNRSHHKIDRFTDNLYTRNPQ